MCISTPSPTKYGYFTYLFNIKPPKSADFYKSLHSRTKIDTQNALNTPPTTIYNNPTTYS